MMKTKTIFPLLLLVVVAGFYCKKEPLTDDSIESYVRVYGALAASGPELNTKLGGARDGSDCDACEPILEKAATDGGFEDYSAFLKTDERIREAFSYIKLTETFGMAKEGMGKFDEKSCMQMMASQKDLSEEQKKERCEGMASGMEVAGGAMDAVGSVMKFFVDEEDVEALRPHSEKIDRAINQKALPCQFDFACPEKNLNLEEAQQ